MKSIPPAIAQKTKVLVVDDEPGLREVLSITFRREGYEVVTASGCQAAVEMLKTHPSPFPLVLTDLVMPDGSGMDVLRAAKTRSDASEVIVMTAHSTIETALEAMRGGAYDFVAKPFSPGEIAALAAKALEKNAIVGENRRLRAQLLRLEPSTSLGSSEPMRKVEGLINKIAATKTTVLITGESGTGKERVARLLHERSGRTGAFLVVNCGALPEALMESELFGHERGSFTGADAKREGLFRGADGGTLLLDEIGELPLSLQVKLLRVLQERRVRPVGGSAEVPVDVRVIAATNRDVEADVKEDRFRQDLYYRLNVIRVELPPLRDRGPDIAQLAEHFVQQFNAELGKDVRGLTSDAIRALESYSFPGNVRELENIIERAVALAGGQAVGRGDLPDEVSGLASASGGFNIDLPERGCMLDDVLGEVERRVLIQALERTGGVRKHAAKLLGITFRSMRYRMAKHGLGEDDGAGPDSSPPSSSE